MNNTPSSARLPKALVVASSVVVLLTLAGCDRTEEVGVGERPANEVAVPAAPAAPATGEVRQETAQAASEVQQDVAKAANSLERKAEQIGAELRQSAQELVQATREGANELQQEAQQAASEAQTAAAGAAAETQQGPTAGAQGSGGSTAVMGAGSAGQKDAGASAMTDGEITSKVKSQLQSETLLSAANIEVDTDDGVVTLKGKAPSEEAKSRASEVAGGIDSVKSVRNELEVDQQASAAAAATTMGAPSGDRQSSSEISATVNDVAIKAKVNTGLSVDKDLSAMKIDVDSEGGVVTLRGSAPSEEAKRRAAEIARNVQDVKDVKNEINVAKS